MLAVIYWYVAGREYIELPRLYLLTATNLVALRIYTHFCSHSTRIYNNQSPYFKSNQIQNYTFHRFYFSGRTDGITFMHIPLCKFERRKKYEIKIRKYVWKKSCNNWMIARMCKIDLISARSNWLPSKDKRGNSILEQSISNGRA